jgi:hypothetical protein
MMKDPGVKQRHKTKEKQINEDKEKTIGREFTYMTRGKQSWAFLQIHRPCLALILESES